jgi:hypothetical protein
MGKFGQLMRKAEDADSKPLEKGLTIPGEIGLREERKRKLEGVKKELEGRYEEIRKGEQAEYEEKIRKKAEKKRESGKTPSPPCGRSAREDAV